MPGSRNSRPVADRATQTRSSAQLVGTVRERLQAIIVWRRDPWGEEVFFFIDESGRSTESEMVLVGVSARHVAALRDIITRARRDSRFAEYFKARRDFHAHEAAGCAGLIDFVLGEFVRMAQADAAEVTLVRIHNRSLGKGDRGFRAYRRAVQAIVAKAVIHRARIVHVHIATLYNDTPQIEEIKAVARRALERRGLPVTHPTTGEELVRVRPASAEVGLQVADAVAYAAYGRFVAPSSDRRAAGPGSKSRTFASYFDRLLELGRVQESELPPPKAGKVGWRPSPRVAAAIASAEKSRAKR